MDKRFIKNMNNFAPALAVLLIISLTVISTMQAAIPGVVFETVSAETPDVEVPQSAPKSFINKQPKKAEEEDKASPVSVPKTDLSKCADGTYTGTGTGYAGYIKVRVVIKSQTIKSIKIVDVEADDPPYMARAKKVIRYIMKAQSLDVDTVSGATYSSNGIISAVADALRKAAGKASKETPKKKDKKKKPGNDPDLDGKKFKDGTYTGVGKGYNDDIHVSVTILDGKINKILVTKHKEDQPYMSDAMKLIDTIIKTQSVKVDTVTGATYSSNGIISAVKDALKKAVVTEDPELDEPDPAPAPAPAPGPGDGGGIPDDIDKDYEAVYGMYVDGTYKGLARGYKSLFYATVVITDGNIASIQITQADDEEYYRQCVGIIDRIITRQTTDGIDTVSGCTYSSRAILDSVKSALAKAKKPELPEGKEEEEDDPNDGDGADDDDDGDGDGGGGEGGDGDGGDDGDDESGADGEGGDEDDAAGDGEDGEDDANGEGGDEDGASGEGGNEGEREA